jgi:predicted RNA-binding Zn-ribbon protein involved in translation (DUF1610 family)
MLIPNFHLSLPLIIIAACLFVVGTIVKTRWFKGKLGEFGVNMLGKIFLDPVVYHRVSNVTIPADDGQGTTQIDHIFVSPYGVFVIETKNINGWIFGGEREPYWTQKLNKRHSQKFQNPLRQNYKHTQTLAELLELPAEKLISVIVFVGDRTEFKTPMPPNVRICRGYVDYIKGHTARILTPEEIDRVLAVIEEKRLAPGFKTDRKHAAYVRSLKEEKQPAARSPVTPAPTHVTPSQPASAPIAITTQVSNDATPPMCPKCGSVMVVRTATRGSNTGNQFWGCPRYPACRGIVD